MARRHQTDLNVSADRKERTQIHRSALAAAISASIQTRCQEVATALAFDAEGEAGWRFWGKTLTTGGDGAASAPA